MSSDTCDPRKTGCTAYPFPHRRNSHPTQRCDCCMIVNGMVIKQSHIDTLSHLMSISQLKASATLIFDMDAK